MMEQWQNRSIESLCQQVTSGGTPSRKRPEFYENGTIPWLKTKELKGYYIADSEEKITSEALAKSSAKLFPPETVLMAMYGDGRTITSLGITRIEAATNQACCAMIADQNECDPKFLLYALSASKDKLLKLALGGAQRNLSGKTIKQFEIAAPDLPTQRRIAGILSAYDDLIENNLRRIRILEEMAQSLYREWFVHFRYPGHDGSSPSGRGRGEGAKPIPLVDSPLGPIPKGWEVKKLKDVTSKIGSGATPKGGKDAYKSEGISLIRSLNIFDYEFKHNNLAFIDEEQAAKLSNVVVEAYDVLLNITGASVARCSMVPSAVLPARVNQHVAIIRANQDSDPFYILDTINSDERKRQILAMAQGGATREALTKTTINNLEIAIPSDDILKRYSQIRRALYDERQTLDQKNQYLRQTRDLLLPKLLAPTDS